MTVEGIIYDSFADDCRSGAAACFVQMILDRPNSKSSAHDPRGFVPENHRTAGITIKNKI